MDSTWYEYIFLIFVLASNGIQTDATVFLY